MRFISKNPESGKNYWIEDYTPEEREMLLGVGFKEKDYSHIPKEFGIKNMLYFTGSKDWTKKEMEYIDKIIMDYFGTGFNIEQFIPD